jgi:hypothetical protein
VAVQTISHELILRINYFSRLTDEQAGEVARIVRPESIDAGGDIITDGESGDSMYLLL